MGNSARSGMAVGVRRAGAGGGAAVVVVVVRAVMGAEVGAGRVQGLVAVVVEAVGVGVGGIRLRQCRQGRRAAAEQRKCRRRYSRRGCMWVQVQMQAMQCRMVCTTVLRCSGRQVGMLGFGVQCCAMRCGQRLYVCT